MTKISEPGIYDLTDADYQAEPCGEPSLRSSIAWKMIARGSTPAHARFEHPSLNPNWKPTNKRIFDIGKACHKLILGKGAQLIQIDAKNYKTDKAQEARDAAYAAGHIPLLPHEMIQVKAMTAAAREQMAALVRAGTIETMPFEGDETEKTIIWRDKKTNVLCRAMLDGLPGNYEAIAEVKTCNASADPALWQWRQMREYGFHFRMGFYRRGLEALDLAYSPEFQFFVIETEEPYLMSFIRIDYELVQLQDKKVGEAMTLWDQCRHSNIWPGYSIEGYDIGPSEREKAELHPDLLEPQQERATGHLESADIASGLTKPSQLVRPRA